MTTERYRITEDAHIYFVTYSIVEWLPVFVSEQPCRIVTDSLKFCHEKKGLCVNAFVIMPTHVHAIVFNQTFDNERLQRSLADFRKFTGRSLSDYCAAHLPICFTETLRASSTADRQRRFWQPSRHPEAIHGENFWRQKLDYLHENPCRKGLVIRAADWRFSSAAFFASDGEQSCDVTISALDWTQIEVGTSSWRPSVGQVGGSGDLPTTGVGGSGDLPTTGDPPTTGSIDPQRSSE